MPYQRIEHKRDPATRLAPESLKKVHPLGKAPVVVDGETTLCESSAVMEYIIDQDAQRRLRPAPGSARYYQDLEWSHFAEGSLGLPVIANLLMKMEERDGRQAMDGYIAKEIAADFAYVEATLAARPYFAGNDFTAADIMMTVTLEMAGKSKLLSGRDNTLAYLARMQQRPAHQRATSFG